MELPEGAVMGRTRASAKAAGSRFNRLVADWFKGRGFPYAEVAPRWGSKDKGDVVNVRTPGGRNIVVEAKDYGGRYLVGEWLAEAEEERVNDSALACFVVAKRRGVTDPGSQVVFLTVRDLTAILTESRPE
jgi:hypothetical protein